MANDGSRSEALRDGPWKLVVHHPDAPPGTFEDERLELYRLDADPGEQSDLAPREPDRAASMLARLEAWYADARRSAPPQPGGWPLDRAR